MPRPALENEEGYCVFPKEMNELLSNSPIHIEPTVSAKLL
jgi:hypothetical protein